MSKRTELWRELKSLLQCKPLKRSKFGVTDYAVCGEGFDAEIVDTNACDYCPKCDDYKRVNHTW